MYYFRITTNTAKYTGDPGVTLTVTDLDVQIAPAEVTEGQSAVLTCKTTCSLTDPTFIWYKNSHHLTTKTSKRNEVRLQSVSSEDAGSYSCAVRGYEHHSPAQTLRVRYPPKNVSVSISPSDVSVMVYVTVGLGLFGLAALLSALFWLRSRRQKKKADEDEGDNQPSSLQKPEPSAQDDTYANVELLQTHAISLPTAPADTPTSPDYENIATLRNMMNK
ncbi:hypothetical protein KOW79_020991 [Hemibagrus wyckioides]|uniref:Ig-like domain-containing protein n=1 Tax=Hemibagrus wyckioides TaxID=337641 RepID=A0A9D3N7W2_9TELE|nr:hypothetical protein KOW79_020991 [Hemibagrus wyckioides]